MDDRGSIALFETDEDAERAGYVEKLLEKETKVLLNVKREKRRLALEALRKKERKSKAKRKAQRAARRRGRK